MPNFHRQTSLKQELNTKKIVTLIIVVTLFLSAFYFAVTVLPNLLSESPNNSENYAVLTIALYQSTNYTQAGTNYEFRYVSGGQANLLQVTSEGQTQNYSAFTGATYNPFGLKVTIFSATESILVLHITPP
ncbi:MAG: hypothetical protein ACQCN3_04890 [Candidatus Bathyarchaeia archaeon]|jgi:hypothetical protein